MCTLTACNPNATGRAADNDMQVNAIFDNAKPRIMPLTLFGEVPETIAGELGIENGIPASVSVILVRKAGKNILFDAGNGNKDSRLMGELGKLGVAPEQVDYIFVTHMHGDHIGGLIKDNQRAFANAKLYIPTVELDAWMNRAEGAPENVLALTKAYEGSLVKFAYTDELPCGVKGIAAPGHTPGHTLYQMDDVMIVGDIMHGVALQQVHPEFCARYDMDPQKAIESRKQVLQVAAKKGFQLYGMHFPTTEALIIGK